MKLRVYTRFLEGAGKWKLILQGDKESSAVYLRTPDGKTLLSVEEPVFLKEGKPFLFSEEDIVPWTPENPALYTLEVKGASGDTEQRKIGFAEIRKEGNQVFFNGKSVKLKGICYRETDQTSPERKRKDLQLLKEANVNYIRSIGGPFSLEFLSLCDELGFWTEDASPLTEVGNAAPATQNRPDLLEKMYLGPFRKIVERDQYHPCIFLWSLGSDCVWGSNFRQMYRYLKETDPDRLAIFHLPMTIPEDGPSMDVWPVHYNDWRLSMEEHYDQMVIFHTQGAHNEIGYATGQAPEETMPVIQDIFAPVACHNLDEIEHDPGVREFWGQSLKRFWEKMEKTKGCLGGAILGAVDDVESGCDWGILDKNHQPKPEYHHVRMVYAPKEPFEKQEKGSAVILSNGRFVYEFSRETCQLVKAYARGALALTGGPYLQATGIVLPPWEGTGMEALPGDGCAEVLLRGHYGDALDIEFNLSLYPDGKIKAGYRVLKLNVFMPHTVKAGIGLDPGGLKEKGIAFLAVPQMEEFSWQRKGLWDWYPKGHIGANAGCCTRENRYAFCSMKHNIQNARLEAPETGAFVLALSDGGHSLRLAEVPDETMILDDRDSRITYTGEWYEREDYNGAFRNTEMCSRETGASLETSFDGTGIRIYGPTEISGGHSQVFIDGKPAGKISQYPKPSEFAIMSRGYEKRHRVCLFQTDSLEKGFHTLKIKADGDGYTILDYLETEAPEYPASVKIIINTDYNYTKLVEGNYHREKVSLRPGEPEECLLCIGREGFE